VLYQNLTPLQGQGKGTE